MAIGVVSKLMAGALLLPAVFGQGCTYPQGRFQAVMAAGYTSQVILGGLRAPRDIMFDPEGNLLIIESGGGGVSQVVITETDGKVCAGNKKQIVTNGQLNHGIAVSIDGKTLFVSSSTTVFAYDYDAASGTATNEKTIITNMQQGGYHQSRTLLVPQNDPTVLLVSRGSDGNIDGPTSQITSGRSQIRSFKIDSIKSSAVAYTAGEVLGWGLRNSVGLGENPATGGIWSVENSVDDMRRSNTDVHNDNPAEELNYHGIIQDAAENPLAGANFGYPDCFSAWDPSKLTANTGISVGTQFVMDSAPGGSTDAVCANEREQAKIVFPSHTAPLDVRFTEDGMSAYVAFHGSWNRSPPDGYRIGRIDFGEDGLPLQSVEESASAVEIVMANQNVNSCPNSCFRPVGLAMDKKGRLFMSSDQSNEIYVVYTPESEAVDTAA